MSIGTQFISSVIKSGQKNYLNRVKDELFQDKSGEKQLINFVRKHVMQYRTLPSPDVLTAQKFEYIDTDQPPEYYQQRLVERAIYNAYKNFDTQMKQYITGNFDLEAASSLILEFNSVVAKLSVADKYKSLAEIGREIQNQIESRKNGNPEVFVPFGWPTIDKLTGGVTGGDLVYIVARPGVGKSQLLSFAAFHAYKQGFSPLVLTMEMTEIQLARRIFGVAGKFNHDAIRRDIPDNKVEAKLSDAIEDIENSEVNFSIMCGQVRQTVESVASLIDELKPDIVYIDAAYLLNLKNSNAKAWEKIALVSEKLKEIAISRNVPIIMTVQFNRQAQNGKEGNFSLETIAGSDAISQLGSVIIAVQPGEAPYEKSRRKLEMIKNREGDCGTIEINYAFDPPDFSEVNYVGENIVTEEIQV